MLQILLEKTAIEDMAFFAISEPKTLAKITRLFEDIAKHPTTGIGKPEALKHQLKGCWSRRITKEHRVVYRIENEKVIIVQCRYHYGK